MAIRSDMNARAVYHPPVSLVEPAPPAPSWPRYGSRLFPPYRFVAGLNPHPRKSPEGHAYGHPEVPPPRIEPDRWRANEEYLHGVDLYNFAYWWECHETLEGLWHVVGHATVEGQFLQGIIQVAAANLKRHVGTASGARGLAGEAIRRLASVGKRTFMGLEIGPFIHGVNDFHVDEDSSNIPMIRLQ